MKKILSFALVIFFLAFSPLSVSAGMLKLLVGYKKSTEKIDNKRVDINDGYWRFPVVDVPKSLEREGYAIVIEGYDTIKKQKETLELVGASVSRNSILFPVDGVLTIENKEDFSRTMNILQEGEKNEKIELVVPARGSISHSFSTPGDYTVVDTMFQWNTVYVRVLKTAYIFSISEGANRIDIPDISPGTYTIRVYYGIRWVYQEDFVMVSNSAQNIGYRIENNSIFSVNTTSYSTTTSMPGDGDD